MDFVLKLEGHDDLGRKTESPVVIPNGSWLAQVSTHYHREEEWDYGVDEFLECAEDGESDYRIVGPEPRVRHVLGRESNRHRGLGYSSVSRSAHYALVGEEPFGVILEEKENGLRTGGLYFICAREIHKGQLGHRPKIARPQFAREAPWDNLDVSPITGKPVSRRDQRRGKQGWARLTDVAALADRDPRTLVEEYFPFTDANHPRLAVRFAEEREEIHGQPMSRHPYESFSGNDLDRLFDRNPTTIWIRRGFAMTALYLRHFERLGSLE